MAVIHEYRCDFCQKRFKHRPITVEVPNWQMEMGTSTHSGCTYHYCSHDCQYQAAKQVHDSKWVGD